MGYYSSVNGTVRMSEEKFRRLMELKLTVPSFTKPITLNEYFEEVECRDGSLILDSYAKHYDLHLIVKVLACFKEGARPDEIIHQGEGGVDDSGVYFILPGKWAHSCFAYPVIDDVEEDAWNEGLLPDAAAGRESTRCGTRRFARKNKKPAGRVLKRSR